MTKLILIVEDDPNQREMLKYALKKAGYDVEEASSGHEALGILSGDMVRRFDLILLDMMIGEITGRDILKFVQDTLPGLPVIVLTGHSSVNNAVEAMRDGAVDFISKPVQVDRLRVSIENALRLNKLSGEISKLNRKWSGQLGFDDLVGTSRAMKKVITMAKKAAGSNVPILLEGESGVGKEVFARAIQGESDRSGKPFVVVNCGAIPGNLVESILFGHEKGAFTGAEERHMGKFADADGGTIFLDEIGELPLDLQVKLLRVLQEGEVDPIGSSQVIKVDVRVISATNRRLKDMVEQGDFREDLFYRLNIFPVSLPPLRHRKSDIEHLVPYFIQNISISEGCSIKKLSQDAMNLLTSYDWPGNIRQLENALFRAVILSDGVNITSADFPQIRSNIMRRAAAEKQLRRRKGDKSHDHGGDDIIMADNILSVLDEMGDIRAIQDVEKDMISYSMNKYNGRMSEVARRLGVGRSTLYRKVAEFGLDDNIR